MCGSYCGGLSKPEPCWCRVERFLGNAESEDMNNAAQLLGTKCKYHGDYNVLFLAQNVFFDTLNMRLCNINDSSLHWLSTRFRNTEIFMSQVTL